MFSDVRIVSCRQCWATRYPLHSTRMLRVENFKQISLHYSTHLRPYHLRSLIIVFPVGMMFNILLKRLLKYKGKIIEKSLTLIKLILWKNWIPRLIWSLNFRSLWKSFRVHHLKLKRKSGNLFSKFMFHTTPCYFWEWKIMVAQHCRRRIVQQP